MSGHYDDGSMPWSMRPPRFSQLELTEQIVQQAEERVSKHWQERIIQRLAESRMKELRDGLPIPLPSSEHAAMSIIRGMADALKQSGLALEQAAKVLKDKGLGIPANAAYSAGQKAKRHAEELVGR